VALVHRHAQPRPDARRQGQRAEVGPARLGGKVAAGDRCGLHERVHRGAFGEPDLGAGQQASGPARRDDVAELAVGAEQQQADAAGAAAAGRGGLDDPLQHHLGAELDRVQAPKLAQGRGELLRVAAHGRLLWLITSPG
jgi:hypothetical protein